LDAIKQVPSYGKFLKNMCSMKRKLNVKKKSFLAEQVSAILQNNNALKYKDTMVFLQFHALLENIKLKELYLILELV
jgi:hypothetical protein